MNQQQSEKFKTWFDDYVAGFYGSDEYVNANIRLKDDHSRRVCGEMLYLANELGVSDNEKAIARAIGLLHDVGRFEQFVKYGTYNDTKSVNHCILGLEILKRTDILSDLDAGERQIIEKAIQYHGQKDLPAGLAEATLLFARMIRDADKLDVFHIVAKYQKQYEQDPGNFMLEVEMTDEPYCSPKVVGAVLDGKLIDYALLQTLNDMRLMQLGWVYNVNFKPTFKRIRQRKFIEKLLDCLPRTEQIGRVGEKIHTYIDSRLMKQE